MIRWLGYILLGTTATTGIFVTVSFLSWVVGITLTHAGFLPDGVSTKATTVMGMAVLGIAATVGAILATIGMWIWEDIFFPIRPRRKQ